ncbi:hypothetical protein AFE_1736 [Acidithiobacillus ferrooxidans ATCC 23270]|uniref:Uncharacterized protein n=1 Tax=Acidithiobacillus ferrooxidans (strain ATCC 23270 / DSM 14882 / CIP 104768 / NCIMB 8455) TaxID=243159 RepID=B7JBJ4_ACIF2|nr:hypothetical protein AFE_1736 [Acidithiobacillus ferrooxidans ATCC 23270]
MMMMTTDIKSSFRKKRHRRIVYRVDDPRFSRRTYGRVIPAAPPPCGRLPLQGTSRATPRGLPPGVRLDLASLSGLLAMDFGGNASR